MGCEEVLVWIVHPCATLAPCSKAVSSHCEDVFVAWVLRCCSEHFVRVVNPRAELSMPVYYLLRWSRVHLAGQLTQSWCEYSFEHPDHRLAVFTPLARESQAVDRVNFAWLSSFATWGRIGTVLDLSIVPRKIWCCQVHWFS